jgi:hypothetical protein
MKTLKESLIDTLVADCAFNHPISVYMNHIVVTLPADEADFYKSSTETEKVITQCVEQHHPERGDDILFCVKKDGLQHTFKIRRSS